MEGYLLWVFSPMFLSALNLFIFKVLFLIIFFTNSYQSIYHILNFKNMQRLYQWKCSYWYEKNSNSTSSEITVTLKHGATTSHVF